MHSVSVFGRPKFGSSILQFSSEMLQENHFWNADALLQARPRSTLRSQQAFGLVHAPRNLQYVVTNEGDVHSFQLVWYL